jgi:multidrug resistance protein, MATE family
MLELSYKKILSIAVPLMFGTLIQSVVMLTDTAFIGHLGNPVYFNAANNAGLIYVSLFMFSKGLADGAQILIARKYGEQRPEEIGSLIFHTQFLQIILSALLFVLFFFFSSGFIHWIVKSEVTGEQMVLFLKYRSWGIFFAGLHASLTAFFIGIGKTRIVLISALIMAGSNIFLDYTLIFGNFGFNQLGLAGAAIASSTAELLAFIFLVLYIRSSQKYNAFRIKLNFQLQLKRISELLRLGVPLMFQGFFALFGWLIFFTLIEREMSEQDLEVSSVIRSIYFIAFIPTFGFGATTRTYVSNLLGQGKPELIGLAQKKLILLSFLSILLFCHGPLIYPKLFIPFINPNPDILEPTAAVMRLVSGSILLFSVITIWFNSVAAIGKSNISFLIESTSILIYLLTCYLFIVVLKLDLLAVWTVEYVYFGVIGVMSYLYLRWYKRKFFNS